jgi:hypothetical protein
MADCPAECSNMHAGSVLSCTFLGVVSAKVQSTQPHMSFSLRLKAAAFSTKP